MLELELMHHWTTITYKSMAYERPESLPLMTIDVPRSALKHEYLLDGIFSFTALHLAYLNQADPHTADYYVAAAVSFRDRGMQRVAPAMQEFHLSEVEPEQTEIFAMFWFSAFAGMVTMALTVVTQREPSNYATSNPPTGRAFINMQIEIAQLWRGTRAIMQIATELRADVYVGIEPREGVTKLGPDLDSRLSELAMLIDKKPSTTNGDVEHDYTPLLRQSVAVLRKSFESWYSTGTLDETMSWGPQLGNDFALLVKEGAPRALLSTMVYGTLLNHVSHKWWAEGAGKALVDECSIALDGCPQDWHDIIRWARAQVELPVREPGKLNAG